MGAPPSAAAGQLFFNVPLAKPFSRLATLPSPGQRENAAPDAHSRRAVLWVALWISLLALPCTAGHPRLQQNQRLPVRFERFGNGFILRGASDVATLDSAGAQIRSRGSSQPLSLHFEGVAGPLEGLDPTGGLSHYLVGSSDEWRTGVTHFRRLRSTNVWPHIDVVYRTTDTALLEYDFIVHPGGDPQAIAMTWSGAESWSLTKSGDLALSAGSRELHVHRPLVYQRINGRRMVIPAAFRMRGNRASFTLGAWDRRHRLVIDPVVSYATYLGGGSTESVAGAVVDTAGRTVVCGTTQSADFPATAGALKSVYAEDGTDAALGDVFVAEFNSSGSLLFATYLGGSRYDECRAVTLDPSGNIYVTGQTHSGNFVTTTGAYQRTFGGGIDAFVVKLNSTGNVISYSTMMGGGENDYGDSVAVDATGSAYVVVNTLGGGFPTTPGSFNPSSATGAYLVKLNPSGSALTYSTFLGRGGYLFGLAQLEIGGGRRVVVDAAGNAFVAGSTVFSSFPTTAGAAYSTFRGGVDGYIMKLSASGSSLLYSSFVGGTGDENVHGLAIDSEGNAIVCGMTTSKDFPQAKVIGNTDQTGMFAAKFNPTGSAVLYATRIAGSSSTYMSDAVLAHDGGIVMAGDTGAADFPVSSNAVQTTLKGSSDAVVVHLSPAGDRIVYATFVGGGGSDYGYAVGLDSAGAAYVVGSTYSSDFPVTAATQGALRGTSDAFVIKISGFDEPQTSKRRAVSH